MHNQTASYIQSKLLNIHDLAKYYTSIILFKAFNKLLPSNIQHFFTIRERTHNLRGYGDFVLPKVRTTRKSFCVSACGVKLWNSLDIQHKKCQNIHRFKLLYKHMVWSQYKESGFNTMLNTFSVLNVGVCLLLLT